ncbi:MAG: lipid-A-disaccharide synthase [Bryobacteraceae bacterium]|nr:lipid-A-disaccharide synthase [Bryobacteraceae bacterium]
MASKILVSAGEASGDFYASQLVHELRRRYPGADFFGCAGPKLREAGVRMVVDAASLGVVGLVEVISHLPRIKGEFDKLIAAAEREKPDLAILTDSPDFHLRLAGRLKRMGVPVVYLIAPQVWAWRQGRVKTIRKVVDRLLCIFPFEEKWFRDRGVAADYIGHPLTRTVRPSLTREQFFEKAGLEPGRPVVALLPGSRKGEIQRHLPHLIQAAERIGSGVQWVLGLPAGVRAERFSEPLTAASIQRIEGLTWDLLAHCDVALAASGTVTIEAALLGTPLITFYRVNALTWKVGRRLVRTPFLSMVNLVARKRIVEEVMQDEMTGERLAKELQALLDSPEAREVMRRDLREVSRVLATRQDPMAAAADAVAPFLKEDRIHVS